MGTEQTTRTVHLNRKIIGPAPARPVTARARRPEDFRGVSRDQVELARVLSSPALLGPPLCDELVAFVAHIFTEEEARVARRLGGPLGRTVAEAAKAAGVEVAKAREVLDRLAVDKGAIFVNGEGEGRKYGLVPVVPGVIELTLSGATAETMTPWQRRVAELFDELFETGYLAHYGGAPFIRYVPAQGSVEGNAYALPSDRFEEVFDRFETFSMIDCECRTIAEVQGRGCGHPKGNCMAMGVWAEQAIAAGYMRSISKGAALEAKREAEASGLVTFVVNNDASDGQASCSCCGCCCYLLRAMNEFGAPAFSAPPHFEPSFDRSRCTFCGRCAQRCPVGALAVEPKRKRAWQIPGRCIGCGQCVLACDRHQAIAMAPVPDYDEPPQSWLTFLGRAAPAASRNMAAAWLRRSPIGRFL